MRAGLDRVVEQEDWGRAAVVASNQSELELTLGEVDAAIRDGTAAVKYADRDGDTVQKMTKRVRYAHALHQAGRSAEAQTLFVEAEALQAKREPQSPLLYTLGGFQYCDLLLGESERAAWRRLLEDGGSKFAGPRQLTEPCNSVIQRAAQSSEIAKCPSGDFSSHLSRLPGAERNRLKPLTLL